MIDPEDLILLQTAQDAGIQLARRFQAMAERLLDNDAAPETAFALIGEPGVAKLIHRWPEETTRNRKIEDDVPLRAVSLRDPVEFLAEPVIEVGVREIPLDKGHSIREPFPCRLVDMVDFELVGGIADIAL